MIIELRNHIGCYIEDTVKKVKYYFNPDSVLSRQKAIKKASITPAHKQKKLTKPTDYYNFKPNKLKYKRVSYETSESPRTTV